MNDAPDKTSPPDSDDRATEQPAAPPADETPEQKRARMMAEVKAKAAAKMAAAKGGATTASQTPPVKTDAATPPRTDDTSPSPGKEISQAGSLPAPPHADAPPSPESQAAPQAKAPSGQSRDTLMGASSGEAESSASAPPSDETPEQKRARIIAEAKAKAAAKMAAAKGDAKVGGETSATTPAGAATSNATSDEEKAARIAEARAKAAAFKQTAGEKSGATTATPATTPTTTPAAAAASAGAPKAPVKKKEEGAKPADASNHPLVKRLQKNLDGAVLEATEFLGQLSVHVAPERVVEVCEFLKRDAESPFNYLSDLTCVHFPERADAPFEVVYNLYSISANVRVRLKAQTTDAEGVESVTGVWPAANWMEREVYDLFGVQFRNHPDLRRILLPPDWEGHPLRKDYPLEPVENNWTVKHLPEFTDVQREQLEQRRAYGLEALSTPDERRVREIFRAGKEVMPLDRK
ncbi:MAG TPA: NADH-quinone oxidoreductase subunit C [Pyrinomonadaceae bacterium]|nr:NADH-quinone oxidoreductase subunit C [Pyrinomonadaceae bacterium]